MSDLPNEPGTIWRSAEITLRCSHDPDAKDLLAAMNLATLLRVIFLFGTLYGGIMGSYGCLVAGQSIGTAFSQVLYSAIKVPLLLLATFVIAVPSFYVLNALAGVGRDFTFALQNIVLAQAIIAVALASLSPLILFWYCSAGAGSWSYSCSILWNTACFGVASFAAQGCLRQRYVSLIKRDSIHRYLLWSWLTIYALVGIQMGWILRPFVGNPQQSTTFLRQDAWDNAYIKLLEVIQSVFL